MTEDLEGAAVADAAGEPAGTLRRPPVRVLLVDDHDENLLALEVVLNGLGAELWRARSGAEALKHLLSQDFAVILLDVQMPEMDGFETAALIRSRERSRYTPVIFMTAVSMSEVHVFRGYSVGAADYIFKPFVPEILRAKVAVFIDLFEKTARVREQANRLRLLESREHRRELARVRDQRNRFFHLSLDMLCILGFDGLPRESNAAWEAALGASDGEERVTPLIERVHPNDRERTLDYWRRLQATDGALPFENRVRDKGGGWRWLSWSSVASVEERVFYVAARDVTEAKEANEALRALNETLESRVAERTRELSSANEVLRSEIAERSRAEERLATQAMELRRSNAELEQFAYVASHDLREPLRKIISFAQLLERRAKGRLGEEADQYLRTIVDGVGRMQELISDLLEYAQIGREEFSARPCDCGAAVRTALSNLAVAIESAGATVECGPMPTLEADPVQLISLFQNLISNAVKFRGVAPSRVEVSARLDGKLWVIAVRDNGIGIEPRFHERVFDVFKRLHSRSEYPGTGIGLAICKKIVERHRGRIWIESEAGKGATFLIALPAAPNAS